MVTGAIGSQLEHRAAEHSIPFNPVGSGPQQEHATWDPGEHLLTIKLSYWLGL